MRRAEDAKSEIHIPEDILERLSHKGYTPQVSARDLHSQYSTSLPNPNYNLDGDDETDFVLF
ncbi:hypothetical protein DPMN_038653 [Dreissena polymorpha]|uniref:Uncharacterized protein n=2 Tax=Dreissena polymorpha TaxID=45954 RepID=A0A9D4MEL8_DREPO|nr:hypothetical protein DPMN_038653 [Dreissena polymorpha]